MNIKCLVVTMTLSLISVKTVMSQAFIDDSRIMDDFSKSADSILKNGNTISVETIRQGMLAEPKPVSILLSKNLKSKISPNQIFENAKKATVIMGSAYLCSKCDQTHVGPASGYVISEDGIVVTNYHVASAYAYMAEGNKALGFMARMFDGKAYAVKAILTASEEDDLAILQLDTKGEKLPTLSLAQAGNVGDKAFVLGHPKGMYYFFSQGTVTHKFIERERTRDNTSRNIMAVSADYAVGSSGGPVLDEFGNVIGTVSSTRTLTYSNENPMVQMIVKNTIPVESLWKLVKKS